MFSSSWYSHFTQGITSKAKTHVSRGSGARMAELAGAEETEIRRLGHWNNQAMVGCYLPAIPRGVMRTMAGFPKSGGGYYLKRDGLKPPENLQKKVFPFVDEWIADEDKESTLAVQGKYFFISGFLLLLKYLRVVILQDAAVLMENDDFSGSPTFKNDVFHCEEFLVFKSKVKLVC